MMTTTRVEDADIASLLERVTAATGPDRVLDLDLARALVPDVVVLRRNDDDTANEPHTYWEYTASIDAALALVERLLPGWSVRIYSHPGAAYVDIYRLGEYIDLPSGAPVRNISSPYYEAVRINDRHVALAIVEALLRSLIQEQKDGAP